jgi:hypothetical protein
MRESVRCLCLVRAFNLGKGPLDGCRDPCLAVSNGPTRGARRVHEFRRRSARIGSGHSDACAAGSGNPTYSAEDAGRP